MEESIRVPHRAHNDVLIRGLTPFCINSAAVAKLANWKFGHKRAKKFARPLAFGRVRSLKLAFHPLSLANFPFSHCPISQLAN